jgi:hypothetical protein
MPGEGSFFRVAAKERTATFETVIQTAGAALINRITAESGGNHLNELFAHLHVGELLHQWTSLDDLPPGITGF